jgi:hypothetical protein
MGDICSGDKSGDSSAATYRVAELFNLTLPDRTLRLHDCAHFILRPNSRHSSNQHLVFSLLRQQADGNQLAGYREPISTG